MNGPSKVPWFSRLRAPPVWAIGSTLLLAALAIRLVGLGDKPFWIAEVQEFAYAYRGGPLDHWLFAAGDFLGFSWHRLCHLLGLEPVPALVRAPAALAGAALPAGAYLLLNRARQPAAGLFTALLLLLSLPLLAMSQEARLYSGLVLFLSLGFLLTLPTRQRATLWRHAGSLGLLDGLALLCHPYAAFWLLVRQGMLLALLGRESLPPARALVRYLPLPLLALAAQVVLVLGVRASFYDLHHFFMLQAYPPDFGLVPDLFAHLGTGSGFPAAAFGALTVGGAYLLGTRQPRQALYLLALGLVTPVLVVTAIWLAGARFSFVHLVPAALPLYLLTAHGLLGLLSGPGTRWAKAGGLVAVVAVIGTQLSAQDLRYLRRPTRLEMGADIRTMCTWLGENLRPGDTLVTEYDKYFTVFTWYCGPVLLPEVPVVVPNRPEHPFVLAFNHLFAQPGDGPLTADRVTELAVAEQAAKQPARVFVVVPYFEEIEGQFSESVGWQNQRAPLGAASGPDEAEFAGFDVVSFPLVKVVWRKTGKELGRTVWRDVERILEAKRPWR